MQIYKIGFFGSNTVAVETSEAINAAMAPTLTGDEGSRELERAEFAALHEFVGKLTVALINKDVFTKDEVNELLNYSYTTEP